MKSQSQLLRVLLILLAYFLVLFLIYLVESQNPEANIRTFPDALWYSMVTLTTVGYGDYYPVTGLGRILSMFFVLGSLGLLGILIGNIADRFHTLKEYRKMGYKGTDFSQHVIILGWDSFARSITEQLIAASKKVAIVTGQKDNLDLIYEEFGKEAVFVLFSDPKTTNLLERVNPAESSVAFINLTNDTDKLITVLNLKKEYPGMEFMVILDNTDLKDTFSSAGVTFILSKNEIAAKLVASYIFEPDVANFTSDLLSSSNLKSEGDYDIQQYHVSSQNPFCNKSFGEAFLSLKQELNVILIGIARLENGQRVLHKVPSDDFMIQAEDYLILILNGNSLESIRNKFGTREGIIES